MCAACVCVCVCRMKWKDWWSWSFWLQATVFLCSHQKISSIELREQKTGHLLRSLLRPEDIFENNGFDDDHDDYVLSLQEGLEQKAASLHSKPKEKKPSLEYITMNGLHVTKINQPPLDILLAERDLSMLSDALKRSPVTSNDDIKRIAATIFAPIDDAFASLPIDITDFEVFEVPNLLELGTHIFEYHIVAPRLIPPDKIMPNEPPLELATRWMDHSLSIQRLEKPSKLGNATLLVDGFAEVVEIIQAKRGWIYKLDSILGPRFNEGPTLMDFIRSKPWLTKILYLMEAAELFNEKTERLGPISPILIPDDGWRLNGFLLPDCVFQTLARPENKPLLLSLLKWMTLPGLWSSHNITEADYLPNAEPPNLAVGHIYPNRIVRTAKSAPQSKEQSHRGAVKRQLFVKDAPNNAAKRQLLSHTFTEQIKPPPKRPVLGKCEAEPFTYENGPEVINLIEERELIASYNIWNGYVHVVNELPMTDKFDPIKALWDCIHEFCFECPKVSEHLLMFFDEGGLIPSGKPLEYIVPPGARPDWVCKGTAGWFPPGWDPHLWARYLMRARKGQKQAAADIGKGSVAAAIKLGELREKLEHSKYQLKQIQTLSYLETQNFRPLWDPQSAISFGSSKLLLDELPHCKKHNDALKVTMDDLQYMVRWMPPMMPQGDSGEHHGGGHHGSGHRVTH